MHKYPFLMSVGLFTLLIGGCSVLSNPNNPSPKVDSTAENAENKEQPTATAELSKPDPQLDRTIAFGKQRVDWSLHTPASQRIRVLESKAGRADPVEPVIPTGILIPPPLKNKSNSDPVNQNTADKASKDKSQGHRIDPNKNSHNINSGNLTPRKQTNQNNSGKELDKSSAKKDLDYRKSKRDNSQLSGRSKNNGVRDNSASPHSADIPKPEASPSAPLPKPELAKAAEVTGVIQVGGVPQIILKLPNEKHSRSVKQGQRLANGQLLVKRIEIPKGSEPVVTLEQYGIEVQKLVGEKPDTPTAGKNSFLKKTATSLSSAQENS